METADSVMLLTLRTLLSPDSAVNEVYFVACLQNVACVDPMIVFVLPQRLCVETQAIMDRNIDVLEFVRQRRLSNF